MNGASSGTIRRWPSRGQCPRRCCPRRIKSSPHSEPYRRSCRNIDRYLVVDPAMMVGYLIALEAIDMPKMGGLLLSEAERGGFDEQESKGNQEPRESKGRLCRRITSESPLSLFCAAGGY